MLTPVQTTELIVSSIMFVIFNIIANFLLGYEIVVTNLAYNALFFFIWYGVFLMS